MPICAIAYCTAARPVGEGGTLADAERARGQERRLSLICPGLLRLLDPAALYAGQRGDQLLDCRQLLGDLGLRPFLLSSQLLRLSEYVLGLLRQFLQSCSVGLQAVQELLLRAAGLGEQLGILYRLVRVLGEEQLSEGAGVALAVLRCRELGGDVIAGIHRLLPAFHLAFESVNRFLALFQRGDHGVVALGGLLGAAVERVEPAQQWAEGRGIVGGRARIRWLGRAGHGAGDRIGRGPCAHHGRRQRQSSHRQCRLRAQPSPRPGPTLARLHPLCSARRHTSFSPAPREPRLAETTRSSRACAPSPTNPAPGGGGELLWPMDENDSPVRGGLGRDMTAALVKDPLRPTS
ncbi:hypothetical protein [Kitasatospora kifunensis]|uniref:hypothetical protein n=1 Tax=Kitasatospora kifunensis TaxID=58351 RepID=UPI00161F6136